MNWLAEPGWLLILPVLPLLWWLHRFRSEDETRRVSALFLWPRRSVDTVGGVSQHRADNIWWLRAAFAGLLITALAQPIIPAQQPITVWIDDSISMYSNETDGQRMTLALASLENQLADQSFSLLTVRALSNPSQAIVLNSPVSDHGFVMISEHVAAPGGEPVLPATNLIESASRHWVVTDHADNNLNDWIGRFAPERVIQIGRVTNNLVLTDFSLRPVLSGETAWHARLTAHNLGDDRTSAVLRIEEQTNTLFESKITLQPGDSEAITFAATLASTARSSTITATLIANDALSLDNELRMPAPGLIRVQIDTQCGLQLRTALRLNPGIDIIGFEQTNGTADAQIACNPRLQTDTTDLPTIAIHDGRHAVPATVAHWSPRIDDPLSLDIRRLPGIAVVDESTANHMTVLMYADEVPLITRSDTPVPRVDVLFDLNHPSVISQPAYPILVARIVDNLLTSVTVDAINRVERNIVASSIAPMPMTAVTRRFEPRAAQTRVTITRVLILIAAMLLIAEIWYLRIRHYRGRISA